MTTRPLEDGPADGMLEYVTRGGVVKGCVVALAVMGEVATTEIVVVAEGSGYVFLALTLALDWTGRGDALKVLGLLLPTLEGVAFLLFGHRFCVNRGVTKSSNAW